jgi:hypothetical protein
MKWHFRQQNQGDSTRDPIVGEFFATEAIENPAAALIREGIQNSLDAGGGKPIHVRIVLAVDKESLKAEAAATWLGDAWQHFCADKNGLRDVPNTPIDCPYLVFEDFGTTGLVGDVNQAFDEPGVKNAFFYFFRAEGRSSKGEADRGRWGVGKHVFPRSSGISTVLGLTVQSDTNKKLLMGHTILKSHRQPGAVAPFTPDGYLGVRPDNLVLPITDEAALEKFTSDFHLSRGTEPGLSLVVPYIDSEFTVEHLKSAIVAGYFHPILKGQLKVTVGTPNEEFLVDKQSLVDVAIALAETDHHDILDFVDLAEYTVDQKDDEIVELENCNPTGAPAWSRELIPAGQLKKLSERLQKGDKVAIRAHLNVREKGKAPAPAHLDIFLRKDGYEHGRAIFIREGIIVSDVRASRTRGIRSMVLIEQGPLATLLGDSENPAHTQWQKDSSNFKGKYAYGKSYIDFVTRLAWNLVTTLQEQDDEVNKNLLVDFFSLPTDEEDIKRPEDKPKEKKGPKAEDDPDLKVEPRKRRFRIQRVARGFAITRGDVGTKPPARLIVKAAYDVRKGSPLKRYDAADFVFNKAPIALDPAPHGLEISSLSENSLVADISDPDFRLTMIGFDPQRDLFVSVRIDEEEEDAQTV